MAARGELAQLLNCTPPRNCLHELRHRGEPLRNPGRARHDAGKTPHRGVERRASFAMELLTHLEKQGVKVSMCRSTTKARSIPPRSRRR